MVTSVYVTVFLWLPLVCYGLICHVGELTWNDVLEREEGRTVISDCAVFWPYANRGYCKKFPYKVANYQKTYYACGNCKAEGERVPYNVSATVLDHCEECKTDNCNEWNAGYKTIVSTSLILLLSFVTICC